MFFFPFTYIRTQISQTQTGWSGSLIQKMRSLRSFPCEEHMDHDLLVDSWWETLSPLCIRRETWEDEQNLGTSCASPAPVVWCSPCVTQRSSQQPLNALWIQLWDCLVEAVAGAQDKFCMHSFTYVCFHLSLNTLNVYSEVIWCLSLTP